MLLRVEQKQIALLQELISRFSQPGDLVVNFTAGTFSKIIACFSLEEHLRFVRCDNDTVCFDIARTGLEDRFAFHITTEHNPRDIWIPTQALEAAA